MQRGIPHLYIPSSLSSIEGWKENTLHLTLLPIPNISSSIYKYPLNTMTLLFWLSRQISTVSFSSPCLLLDKVGYSSQRLDPSWHLYFSSKRRGEGQQAFDGCSWERGTLVILSLYSLHYHFSPTVNRIILDLISQPSQWLGRLQMDCTAADHACSNISSIPHNSSNRETCTSLASSKSNFLMTY